MEKAIFLPGASTFLLSNKIYDASDFMSCWKLLTKKKQLQSPDYIQLLPKNSVYILEDQIAKADQIRLVKPLIQKKVQGQY